MYNFQGQKLYVCTYSRINLKFNQIFHQTISQIFLAYHNEHLSTSAMSTLLENSYQLPHRQVTIDDEKFNAQSSFIPSDLDFILIIWSRI